MTALCVGIYQYLRHRNVDWWGLLILAVIAGFFMLLIFKERRHEPSTVPERPVARARKLRILSAVYGPYKGKGEGVDVTEVLRGLLTSDALAVIIDNDLFGDPAIGKAKRLQVSYSYGSPAVVKIERRESDLMVLPEDTFLKEQAENNHAQEPTPQPLFAPLQIEAFQLVKDLRDFAIEVGPKPTLNMKLYDGTLEGNAKALSELYEREQLWSNNLKAGYVLKFQKRVVDAYYHFMQSGHKSETLASLAYTAHSEQDIQGIVIELWKLVFLVQE